MALACSGKGLALPCGGLTGTDTRLEFISWGLESTHILLMLCSCSYSYLESHANIQTRTGLSHSTSFLRLQPRMLSSPQLLPISRVHPNDGRLNTCPSPPKPATVPKHIHISNNISSDILAIPAPPPRFTSTLQSLCRKPAQVASLIQPSQLATITPEDRRHKGEKDSPNPQHPSQTPCPHRISLFPFDPRHLSPLFPTASLPRFSHRQHAHSRPSSSNRHPGNGQTLVGSSLTR